MPSKLLGRVNVTFAGAALRILPGATLDMGGVTRATVAGSRDVGYSETTVPSAIDCVVMYDADTELQPIRDGGEGSATFETDTGQVYSINRCWCVNPPRLAGGGGQVTLRFEGEPAQEVR